MRSYIKKKKHIENSLEGWEQCISTPIDKIPRYLLHSRKNVILYWRGLPVSNASNALGRRMQRASKRRIYFVGRAIVSARHRKTDTRNNTYTCAHVNENTRTRNTASLKARKKSQTRLNVDAGRQIFLIRDRNDRLCAAVAIREIRRRKTQSGNRIVSV